MRKKYEEDYEEYEDDEEEQPRRRFPFGCLILLVVLAGLVFLIYNIFQCYQELGGASELGSSVTVSIGQGATASEISTQLMDDGVIERDWLFRLYAKYSGKASNLQPGDVELKPGMSYNDILKALSTQRIFRSTLKGTFPEGSTSVAIAQSMAAQGIITEDEIDDFLACANGQEYTERDGTTQTADFSQYDFWNAIPADNGRLFRSEGYLFPNTYEFFSDDTIYNYVNTFYSEFDSEISGLMEAINADAASGTSCIKSIDDAVILASFIQEEAGMAEEDAHVSAVFHNRLESSDPLWAEHRLESNASSYIANDSDNNYLWNSPVAEYEGWVAAGAIPEDVLALYDTYRVSGLPAGAISNPGYAAIAAAVNPDQEYIDAGYYFFVTGNPNGDYPGQYFYAKTADEHSVNVSKAGW